MKRAFRLLYLPVVSGVLLAVSMPMAFASKQLNTSPLFSLVSWFALVPLLHALKPKEGKHNFLKGFVSAFVFHWLVLYWVTHSMIFYGNLSLATSCIVLTLLVIYMSLYVGLFTYVADRFGSGITRCFVGASVWVLLEYFRGYFMTGFPWCHLGYSQGNLAWMRQNADVFGVYGLSFVVVFFNLAILEAWRYQKAAAQRKAYLTLSTVAGLLLLCFIYGQVKLSRPYQSETYLDLALLQGNIPQDQKWNYGGKRGIARRYLKMSEQHLDSAKLIIWPEASWPYSVAYDQKNIQRLRSWYAKIANSKAPPYLILGAPSYIPKSREVMNSAFLVGKGGKLEARYDKIHLVLYGEYVPLADFLPIKKLTRTVGNFKAGEKLVPFIIDSDDKRWNIAPSICYEVTYPELSRKQVGMGSHLFVNITNDAWFGRTSGPYQHLNIARFRAIENRRFLARAANTGVSAVVTPHGDYQITEELNQQAIIQATLPMLTGKTPYVLWGDWPLALLLIVCALLLRRQPPVN